MNKIWKDVIGYKELYIVSNHGEIKSLGWKVPNGNTFSYRKGRILKPKIRGRYHAVDLYTGQCRKTISVHRIVAQAFIANPEYKPHVNHIDGDRMNNNATNLEWVTPSENLKHAFKIGLRIAKVRCVAQIDIRTRKILHVWPSIKNAAIFFGLPNGSNIIRSCKNKGSVCKGYLWRYHYAVEALYQLLCRGGQS